MAAYRWTHGRSRLAWSESWQPTGAELYLSDQVNSRNDITINIVLGIIFFLIITLDPGTQFTGWIKKLSIQKNKAGMVNPAGPQQKNCRAARQS